MTDDDTLSRGSSQHPMVTEFKKTISNIRNSTTSPPMSMIREKRNQLRQRRLELEAEVEEMMDEEDDRTTESLDLIVDDPVGAPA